MQIIFVVDKFLIAPPIFEICSFIFFQDDKKDKTDKKEEKKEEKKDEKKDEKKK